MKKEVIAVFDIGKTNKKFLLFDRDLMVVSSDEVQAGEVADDDGFPGEDADRLVSWMKECIEKTQHYTINAINFATYGATLAYLDRSGKRAGYIYNYLKPMPGDVLDGFYERYGGVDEFSRKTASPQLGMLNSGLQMLWIKRVKPELFRNISACLHLPQYLSYCFTGKVTSECTSIGCHTALWDFDRKEYHHWLKDEGITLPGPSPVTTFFDVKVKNQVIKTFTGIHDSSASLVPYLKSSEKNFILMSTGTWCITMNPFNHEPLTIEQLKKDCLCYMNIYGNQVKSSRFFLGHIYAMNLKRISDFFNVDDHYYRTIKADPVKISELTRSHSAVVFFKTGIPEGYIDNTVDLSIFNSFEDAYYRFMADLVKHQIQSFNLVIPRDDKTEVIYISGGFAKNDVFVGFLRSFFPGKQVITKEIDNATALGAAMIAGNVGTRYFASIM